MLVRNEFPYKTQCKLVIKELTLGIIYRHPEVLLGMKKRGFGVGRWNGFGGKLVEGENLEQALKREFLEETGLVVSDFEKRGIVDFKFFDNPEVLRVHIYLVREFEGSPEESEEMRPKWFAVDAIPFQNMWPDDIFWFPLFLAGKKFTGKFWFGARDTILKQELSEVLELKV